MDLTCEHTAGLPSTGHHRAHEHDHSGGLARVATGTFPGARRTAQALTLNAGASCTIRVQYTAQSPVGTTSTGSVAITGSVAVANAPVSLSGTSAARPA